MSEYSDSEPEEVVFGVSNEDTEEEEEAEPHFGEEEPSSTADQIRLLVELHSRTKSDSGVVGYDKHLCTELQKAMQASITENITKEGMQELLSMYHEELKRLQYETSGFKQFQDEVRMLYTQLKAVCRTVNKMNPEHKPWTVETLTFDFFRAPYVDAINLKLWTEYKEYQRKQQRFLEGRQQLQASTADLRLLCMLALRQRVTKPDVTQFERLMLVQMIMVDTNLFYIPWPSQKEIDEALVLLCAMPENVRAVRQLAMLTVAGCNPRIPITDIFDVGITILKPILDRSMDAKADMALVYLRKGEVACDFRSGYGFFMEAQKLLEEVLAHARTEGCISPGDEFIPGSETLSGTEYSLRQPRKMRRVLSDAVCDALIVYAILCNSFLKRGEYGYDLDYPDTLYIGSSQLKLRCVWDNWDPVGPSAIKSDPTKQLSKVSTSSNLAFAPPGYTRVPLTRPNVMPERYAEKKVLTAKDAKSTVFKSNPEKAIEMLRIAYGCGESKEAATLLGLANIQKGAPVSFGDDDELSCRCSRDAMNCLMFAVGSGENLDTMPLPAVLLSYMYTIGFGVVMFSTEQAKQYLNRCTWNDVMVKKQRFYLKLVQSAMKAYTSHC